MQKQFWKMMNKMVFEKTMQNVNKHKNIKLVITETRRNYLVPEPNFCTAKFFTENLLAADIKNWNIYE